MIVKPKNWYHRRNIGFYLRWKLKNLGFEYDPFKDDWFWGWKRQVRLDLDQSIGMFIWSASVVTAKAPASYVDDRHATICWNQSMEEFLKLKRSTIAYYIGDMVRERMSTVTK